MADLQPSLVATILPTLGRRRSREGGLREWIIEGKYLPAGNSNAQTIILQNFDAQSLVDFLAYDFARFSLASYESFAIACTENAQRNAFGWPLLKLYYSAFFGAHSIVRSQGVGIVRLEAAQAHYLNQVISIISQNNPNITKGDYEFTVSTNSLVLSKVNQSRGAHENFWKYFCSALKSMSAAETARGAINASQFVAGAGEIEDAVKFKSGDIWFSAFRNEINYQHKHNVWLPIVKSGDYRSGIANLRQVSSNTIALPRQSTSRDVRDFIRLAHYVACLSLELSSQVASRSRAGGTFGQKWQRITALI